MAAPFCIKYALGDFGAVVRYFQMAFRQLRPCRRCAIVLPSIEAPELADCPACGCGFCICKICLPLSAFPEGEIRAACEVAVGRKFWHLSDSCVHHGADYISFFHQYTERMVAAIRCVCGLFCRSAACKGIAEDPVCRQIFVSIKIYTVRIAELTVRFRPKG